MSILFIFGINIIPVEAQSELYASSALHQNHAEAGQAALVDSQGQQVVPTEHLFRNEEYYYGFDDQGTIWESDSCPAEEKEVASGQQARERWWHSGSQPSQTIPAHPLLNLPPSITQILVAPAKPTLFESASADYYYSDGRQEKFIGMSEQERSTFLSQYQCDGKHPAVDKSLMHPSSEGGKMNEPDSSDESEEPLMQASVPLDSSFHPSFHRELLEAPITQSLATTIPEQWQWDHLGYLGANPHALAPNGSGKTLLECYQAGVDPNSPLPQEPFSLSLVAGGPYRSPANINLVAHLSAPEGAQLQKLEFSQYTGSSEILLATVEKPPYEVLLSNYGKGIFSFKAKATWSNGIVKEDTTLVHVTPYNWYLRCFDDTPIFDTSMVVGIDAVAGSSYELAYLDDFSSKPINLFPWYLRAASIFNEPCYYLHPDGHGFNKYEPINSLPTSSGKVTGGSLPLASFGKEAGGKPLFTDQSYRFGIKAGGQRSRPPEEGDIVIEVYDKNDFQNGATQVAPVVTKHYILPRPSNTQDWDQFIREGAQRDYHIDDLVKGRKVDFMTKISYPSVENQPILNFGQKSYYAYILEHQARNDQFYFKISIKGTKAKEGLADPSLPSDQDQIDLAHDSHGQQSPNLNYTLDFSEPAPWQSTLVDTPQFEGEALPSAYQGKSLKELIHESQPIVDQRKAPSNDQWKEWTTVDQSPELKSHPVLDQLLEELGNDPINIANYVQNEIELSDAIGLHTGDHIDNTSLNLQGMSRDAMATYMEAEGSPVEQCALLVYLLRKAGVPAGYVFPEENRMKLFDQQLSQLLHVALRGAADKQGILQGLELIPVNYPWVTAYIDGKWVHLFPWLKDTEVEEGKDLWPYFPEGCDSPRRWIIQYILNNPAIRELSPEDSLATLFPLYAQKCLQKVGLQLSDIGIRYHNRNHYYTQWKDFPRPWQTGIVQEENITPTLDSNAATQTPHLKERLKDLFNTIEVTVFSDRNGDGKIADGEPMVTTGPLRLLDLHDRQILLHHELIPNDPNHIKMILSLEPYEEMSEQNHDSEATYTFYGGSHQDPGDLRHRQERVALLENSSTKDNLLKATIVESDHRQANNNRDNNGINQLFSVGEILTTSRTVGLQKGDMACLVLNYGQVTDRMEDCRRTIFSDYEKKAEAKNHTDLSLERKVTANYLAMMGNNYYKYCNNFTKFMEQLLKVHLISHRAFGFTKMSPLTGKNGEPLIEKRCGQDEFKLYFPNVDMLSMQSAFMGNKTNHLESGLPLSQSNESFDLMNLENSVQEHEVLKRFYHDEGAISTVKLLDLAQGWRAVTHRATEPGKGVAFLTSNNYIEEGNRSYSVNYEGKTTEKSLKDWAGSWLWKAIEECFSDSSKERESFVIITPGAVEAKDQKKSPYLGVGAFLCNGGNTGALISGRMSLNNGGNSSGQSTQQQIVIYSRDSELKYVENSWIEKELELEKEFPQEDLDLKNNPTVPANPSIDLYATPPPTSWIAQNNLLVEPTPEPTDTSTFENISSPNYDPLNQQYDPNRGLNDPTSPFYIGRNQQRGGQPPTQQPQPQASPTDSLKMQPTPTSAPSASPKPSPNIPESLKIGGPSGTPEQTPTPLPTPPTTEATPAPTDPKKVEQERKILENGVVGEPRSYVQKLHWVIDPVNPATGEFYDDVVDLHLAGPMPLDLRRSYGSQNLSENHLGVGWKLSSFPFLGFSIDDDQEPEMITATEQDGSVIAYRKQEKEGGSCFWQPLGSDNPTLLNGNGEEIFNSLRSQNLFNNRIFERRDGSELYYDLYGSDGRTRHYHMESYQKESSLGEIECHRPYLQSWEDGNGNALEFERGQDRHSPDYGELKRIVANNGNSLQFHYNFKGHITDVFSNDGRHVHYEYDDQNDLTAVTLPDGSQTAYQYKQMGSTSTHQLIRKIEPEGRILENQYDPQGRITSQGATTSQSGQVKTNARIQYDLAPSADDPKSVTGTTTITDIQNKRLIYKIDHDQVIESINQNRESTKSEWERGIYGYQKKSTTDPRGLKTTYAYDRAGNVISITQTGNLTGKSSGNEAAVTQLGYTDTGNRLATITNPLGEMTHYQYGDRAHPYSPTAILKKMGEQLSGYQNYHYGDVGAEGISACGLLTESNDNGAITHYSYDTHGFLSGITQESGSHDPALIQTVTTNRRGEMTSMQLPSGARKSYDYNAMGERISEECYDATGNLIDWHFNYYNGNAELSWEQGAAFNPVDYHYYHYDHMGHMVEEDRWQTAAIDNRDINFHLLQEGGIASSFHQYDDYGNETKSIDPNGNQTEMQYDPVGNLTHLLHRQGNEILAQESYSYAQGNRVKSINALGGVTTTAYNSRGALTEQHYPNGTTEKYHYDLLGRMIDHQKPNGSTELISYDDAKHQVSKTLQDSKGEILEREVSHYDARGNLIAYQDPAGNLFQNSYDSLNRIKKSEGPVGDGGVQSSYHIYNDQRGSHGIINAQGDQSWSFYDPVGRLLWSGDYDRGGNLIDQVSNWYHPDHHTVISTRGSESAARTTTISTNELGEPLILEQNDGHRQTNQYDGNGNLIFSLDMANFMTQWKYDGLNRLIEKDLPGSSPGAGAILQYHYNNAGELTQCDFPEGIKEIASYNNAGELLSRESIDTTGKSVEPYHYSYTAGELTQITDPRGIHYSLSYDGASHLLEMMACNGGEPSQNKTRTYQYDPHGWMTSVEEKSQDPNIPSSCVQRHYDPYGELCQEKISINGSPFASWQQQWDGAGHRTGLKWSKEAPLPGGSALPEYHYHQNGIGELLSVAATGIGESHYRYNDAGQLLESSNPFLQKNYSYGNTALSQIITRLMGRDSTPDSPLMQEELSWYTQGVIANYDSSKSQEGLRNILRYSYDPQYRLMIEDTFDPQSHKADPTGNATAPLLGSTQYSYDQASLPNGPSQENGINVATKRFMQPNWTFATMEQDGLRRPIQESIYLPEYQGQQSPIEKKYDAAGNLIQKEEAAYNGQETLHWDSDNRLIGIDGQGGMKQPLMSYPTTSQYHWKTLYDGLGRRLQTSYTDRDGEKQTINYYYDPSVEFLELGHTISSNGNSEATWNLYGPDRSGDYGGAQGMGGLEMTQKRKEGTISSPEVYGVINNYYGDALGKVDSHGKVTPYGTLLGAAGPMLGQQPNHHLEPEWRGHYIDPTGLYYFGARYYDPAGGRFLSEDPLGREASTSLYDYCANDPVNRLDPDGRMQKEEGKLNDQEYHNANYMMGKMAEDHGNAVFQRSVRGFWLSYHDGDLNMSYKDIPATLSSDPNNPLILSVNGMNTKDLGAKKIGTSIANYLDADPNDIILAQNNTLGGMTEFSRVLHEQAQDIDIRSMKFADQVNAYGANRDSLDIFAYSNGSAIVGNARPYIQNGIAAKVDYYGLNPQWHIEAHQYGFHRAVNMKNQFDMVSILSPSNWFRPWDKVITTPVTHLLHAHEFQENYDHFQGPLP